MKLLDKLLQRKKSLNFKSVLVITYGRSGSTLLQGILNSIEGVLIRGENYNFCFHLFKSYQALLKTNKQVGTVSQNPFFGAELIDETYFIAQMRATIQSLLLADQKEDASVQCYWFKEIRYSHIQNDLPNYFLFLEKVFPDSCFPSWGHHMKKAPWMIFCPVAIAINPLRII